MKPNRTETVNALMDRYTGNHGLHTMTIREMVGLAFDAGSATPPVEACTKGHGIPGASEGAGQAMTDHATKPSERIRADAGSTLNDFHRVNSARQHEAFAPPHSLTALVVCVQEEVGELAAAVLGYTGEKKRKAHLTRDDVLDAVADAMTYLSLVASNVGCFDLEELLGRTFNMVSTRAGSKITTGLGAHLDEQAASVNQDSSGSAGTGAGNHPEPAPCEGPGFTRPAQPDEVIATPAASLSGEVAAPSPVERELGPEDFADSDCEACEGSGRIDTSGGPNDIYRGWRWCDCAIDNRTTRRAEQAPQAEATLCPECPHPPHAERCEAIMASDYVCGCNAKPTPQAPRDV